MGIEADARFAQVTAGSVGHATNNDPIERILARDGFLVVERGLVVLALLVLCGWDGRGWKCLVDFGSVELQRGSQVVIEHLLRLVSRVGGVAASSWTVSSCRGSAQHAPPTLCCRCRRILRSSATAGVRHFPESA